MAVPRHGPSGIVAEGTGSGGSHRHHGTTIIFVPWLFSPFFFDATWGYPYYYDGYAPYGYPPYGYAPGPYALGEAAGDEGYFELHVHPRKASVIVDGRYVGQARDFNDLSHPLMLAAGGHVLEMEYPGFQTLRVEIDAEAGRSYDLHFELYEGEGDDPRSIKPSTGEPSTSEDESVQVISASKKGTPRARK